MGHHLILFLNTFTVYSEIQETAIFQFVSLMGYGGTVSPSGMHDAWPKSDPRFTVKANPGFVIADVIVDNQSVGALASYSFKVINENHKIFVRFKSEKKDPSRPSPIRP